MKNYTDYVMDQKVLVSMTPDELERSKTLLDAFTDGALRAAAAFGHICPLRGTGTAIRTTWIIGELIRYDAEQENRMRENARTAYENKDVPLTALETHACEKPHLTAEQEARMRENAHIAYVKFGNISSRNPDELEHDTELEDAWMDGALQAAAAFGHRCPVEGEVAQRTWIIGEIVRYEAEQENRMRENARLIFVKFGLPIIGNYKLQQACAVNYS